MLKCQKTRKDTYFSLFFYKKIFQKMSINNNNPLTQKHEVDKQFEQHKKEAAITAMTESISQEFETKTWAEEYKPMYGMALFAVPFLNLCSILLGFYFVYGLLNEGIGYWWLSGALAVGLLTLIEYVKNFTVRKSSVAYFKHQTTQSTILGGVTVAIVLLSAITSMLGGDTIMQKAGLTEAQAATTPLSEQMQQAQQRIDKVVSDREAYRTRTGKTASWMGKEELAEATKTINALKSEQATLLSQAKDRANTGSTSILLLTFLIELGIIGLGIFKVYYAFRAYHTKQLAKKTVTALPVQQMVSYKPANTVPHQTNTDTKISNNIGFKTPVATVATVATVDTVATDTETLILALKTILSNISAWEGKPNTSTSKAENLARFNAKRIMYEAKLKARNIELKIVEGKRVAIDTRTNNVVNF